MLQSITVLRENVTNESLSKIADQLKLVGINRIERTINVLKYLHIIPSENAIDNIPKNPLYSILINLDLNSINNSVVLLIIFS